MKLLKFSNQRYDPKDNAFDFLRLLLAIMVVYAHSWHNSETLVDWRNPTILSSDMYLGIIPMGQLVVYGFFVISGFLITASWIRRPDIKDFLAKRFLRIYPGFMVSLVLVATFFIPLIYLLKYGTLTGSFSKYALESWRFVYDNMGLNINRPRGFVELFSQSYMLEVNGPLWSLIFEAKAYLMVVVMALLGFFQRKWKVVAAAIIIWVFYALAVYHPGLRNLERAILGDYKILPLFTYFLVGSVMYIFNTKIVWDYKIALTTGIYLAVFAYFNLFALLAPVALTYILLYLAIKLPIKNLSSKIGDLSYGVYIYSWPIQQCLNAVDFNYRYGFLAYFLVSAALSLGAGYLSWNLVEKRFLVRKTNITNKVILNS